MRTVENGGNFENGDEIKCCTLSYSSAFFRASFSEDDRRKRHKKYGFSNEKDHCGQVETERIR